MAKVSSCIGMRFLILTLCVTACFVLSITRSNINIAIVSMTDVNGSHFKSVNHNLSVDSQDKEQERESGSKVYNWNQEVQGTILGSFYWTYMLLQVPSGVIIESFGSRWLISFGLFISFLINVITPFLTNRTTVLIISRVILGAAQAGVFPGCFKLGVKWFPIQERSFAFSLLRVGAVIGNVVISFLTGFICMHLGWEAVFYISSVFGFVSSVIFALLTTDTPEQHPFITGEEILFIKNKEIQTMKENEEKEETSSPSIPWLKILTNIPILVNGLYKFSHFWVLFTLHSKLPTYLAEVINMDIAFNGVTNAIMNVSYGVSLSATGYVSDRVVESGILSRTNTRKVFTFIAGFGSGFAVILIPVVGSSVPSLIILLVVGFLCQGFSSGGDVPLPSEMSKKYPATIFALVNMMSMISGSVAPMTVGYILNRSSDVIQSWKLIFTSAGIFSMICTVIFILFASAERQPFDFHSKLNTVRIIKDRKHSK